MLYMTSERKGDEIGSSRVPHNLPRNIPVRSPVWDADAERQMIHLTSRGRSADNRDRASANANTQHDASTETSFKNSFNGTPAAIM